MTRDTSYSFYPDDAERHAKAYADSLVLHVQRQDWAGAEIEARRALELIRYVRGDKDAWKRIQAALREGQETP